MKKFAFLFIISLFVFVSCVPVKEKPQSQVPIPKSLTNTIKENQSAQPNWKDVPALKDALSPYFDYFGFAMPEGQIKDKNVMEGASYQASCFTCENECKPDFIFNWA